MPAACISGSMIAIINYFFNDIAYHEFKLPYGFDYITWCCGLHLWYIRSIVIIYFISPLIFHYIKNKFSLQKASAALLFILILFSATTYLSRYVHTSIQTLYQMSIIWTIFRLPAFMAGMFIACYGSSFHTKPIHKIFIFIFCLSMALLFRSNHIPPLPIISHYYQLLEFLFIIPPVIIFSEHLDLILRLLPEFARKALFWLGTSSLELYVVHEALYRIIGKGMVDLCNHRILLLFSISASLLAAYLLKLGASSIQRRFSSLR